MRDLGWNVKGQPWPLELIYSHWLIRLDISSENDDFGINSFQKIIFSKLSLFKCMEANEFNWLNGFWENCFNILMGLQYERPWLKGQRSSLTFGTYKLAICHISLNISSENNNFGFNSFQKKCTFKKKSNLLNALGSKFDLDVK